MILVRTVYSNTEWFFCHDSCPLIKVS